MSHHDTVGVLRRQAAMSNANRKVIVVSSHPTVASLDLQVVGCYPDTVDHQGNHVDGGVFKIQVEPT